LFLSSQALITTKDIKVSFLKLRKEYNVRKNDKIKNKQKNVDTSIFVYFLLLSSIHSTSSRSVNTQQLITFRYWLLNSITVFKIVIVTPSLKNHLKKIITVWFIMYRSGLAIWESGTFSTGLSYLEAFRWLSFIYLSVVNGLMSNWQLILQTTKTEHIQIHIK
jgi:hypothetical protein